MPGFIVRLPNHLGDACMALPALDLLATAGPLTLVGKGWIKSLFAAYPWATEPLPARLLDAVTRLRTLRQASAGARGVLFTNSFGTALQFRLAGLSAAAYATDGRGWLLGTSVPVPAAWSGPGMHTVQYYHALAARITGRAGEVSERLALRTAPAHQEKARAMLTAAGVQGDYVVLCPVAVGLHHGRVKAWSGFSRLTAQLLSRGATVVSCPGPGEREAVQAAVPGAVVLPETDVGSFAALLQGSRLVVANDSGPGHLAAAVGTPLISVFGVTEPEKTQPWGTQVHRVGSGAGWPSYDEVWTAVAARLGLP